MIARARVLLPKTLLIPLEDEPDPVDLDLGAYRAKLFRPYRSELAEVAEELPLSERPGLLRRCGVSKLSSRREKSGFTGE
jgi:hypothetical protein